MRQGKLVGIAARDKSRASMVEFDRAEITSAAGVGRDFRGKPGPRQVTVLSAEAWSDACLAVDQDLPWTTRRANLLVEGLNLEDTTGATLRCGQVVLRISDETEPCQRMEEQCPGLVAALTPQWRGGVSCQVVAGGIVEVGAEIQLEMPRDR